jgi:FtsH-binding integral membrane protein
MDKSNKKKQFKQSKQDKRLKKPLLKKTNTKRVIIEDVAIDIHKEKDNDKDDTDTCVHKQSKRVRMCFLRKVMFTLLLELAFTLGMSYVCLLTHVLQNVITQNWWILIPVGILLIIIIFIYWFTKHSIFLMSTQIVLNIYATIVITCLICVVTSFFDTMVFIQSTAAMLVILFVLFLYLWQPFFGFSPLIACFFTFIFSILLGFIVIYIPNNDWITSGVNTQWLLNMPTIFQTTLAMIFANIFCIYTLYDLASLMHRLPPSQSLHAAFRLYIDIIAIFTIMYSFTITLSPKRGFMSVMRGRPRE